MRRQRYKPQRSETDEEKIISRVRFYRRLKYSIYALGIIILIILLWRLPQKVIIKNVVCVNKDGVCSERMVGVLNQHIGQNMHDAKRSINAFLSTELIRESSVRYLYPGTLEVSLVETKPQFGISNMDLNDFRLVDSKGYVVGKAGTNTLPNVKTTEQLPEIGTKVSDETLFGLQLMRDLAYSYQIDGGEFTSDSLVIELPTSQSVIFPLEGERDLILGSFVLVMNQLNSVKSSSTMEKGALTGKTVDLRYKNPIIR